jgi:hypothetical protein
MRCLHCAKEISIQANVCPWCDRETETSKEYHGKVMLWSIVTVAVGYSVGSFFGWETGLSAAFGTVVYAAIAHLRIKVDTPTRKVQVEPVLRKRIIERPFAK